jgi:L-fuconolactonase
MLQDLDDDAWIADPALAPAAEAMQRHGLSMDGLVLPRHLPALLDFAQRYPALPLVIDHGAKPLIASGELEPWRRDLERLARLPHVHCKLSGLVTEAGAVWSVEKLRPYAQHILDAFGPRRVIWGSDWPVLELAAGYGQWLAACEDLLAGLEPAAREDVFGLNAVRFYRLD